MHWMTIMFLHCEEEVILGPAFHTGKLVWIPVYNIFNFHIVIFKPIFQMVVGS